MVKKNIFWEHYSGDNMSSGNKCIHTRIMYLLITMVNQKAGFSVAQLGILSKITKPGQSVRIMQKVEILVHTL